MSRKSRTTLSVVEKLIEQRRLFQDWLTKLTDGVDGMPPHVVERVRNDYRTRLDGVTTELGEHSDALREALAEAQERHTSLEADQQHKKDELAELRLRRHVGEMDDDRFKQESGDLQSAIDAIKKDVAVALRDIERYEEILEIIASGEKKPEAPAAAAPVEPAPEPQPKSDKEAVAAQDSEGPRPARAPGASPAAESPARDKDKKDTDELAFLRSVTTTVSAVKAPPPPSPAPTPPPAPRISKPVASPVKPARAEEPASVGIDAAPGLVDVPGLTPESMAAAPAPPRASAAKPAGDASLVCKECGAVNRPTEWYCEKCGAELAAF